MMELILIASGLFFGVLMLGLGYLLGKRNKVQAQILDVIDKVSAHATSLVNAGAEAAKNQVSKA